jgi:nucleotide-binding universal stress UspA family protein
MAKGDVVVGLYDSASAQAALRWAAKQANATQAPLCAVHVLEWPIGLTASTDTGPATQLHLPENNVEIAYRRGMSRIFNEIDPQPGWTLQFAEGGAAEVLVRHGEEAGLLVIGTQEHTSMGRFQSGSVSHYCISHATCPVVVVPVEYL